jgi:hypothetical protein
VVTGRGKPTPYAGALAVSVSLLLLSVVAPLPAEVRLLIVLGLAFGWAWVASRWAVRRFGRMAGLAIAAVALMVGALGAGAYWRDEPNRRLVAAIEQLPGCYTANSRGLLVGKVEHVYINSQATDREVTAFTELSGLDDLQILFLNGPRITDATARRLGRLRSLRHLCLSETGVSAEVAEELQRELPWCSIEIR